MALVQQHDPGGRRQPRRLQFLIHNLPIQQILASRLLRRKDAKDILSRVNAKYAVTKQQTCVGFAPLIMPRKSHSGFAAPEAVGIVGMTIKMKIMHNKLVLWLDVLFG